MKMGLKFRQIRKFAVIVSFLAIIFIVYLAAFSASYPCHDQKGRNCNEGTFTKKTMKRIDDKTRREVQMLIEEGHILKRSYDEDVSRSSNLRSLDPRRNSMNSRKDSHVNSAGEFGSHFISPKRKSVPSTKPRRVVTLSNSVRNFEVKSMFIQIKEADSPRIGDFQCSATIVPNCCAFTVGDTNEAKRICEAFGEFCKGFVMSTISSKADSFEYVMYLKKNLNGTMANYLTDFFIKVDFLDELKWNNKR